MQRRAWNVRHLLFLTLGVAGSCDDSAAPGPTGSRNLLLISVEHLRVDSLEGGSLDSTPSLSALRDRARRYLQCRTPVPALLSAHASLFTGLAPREHGVYLDELFRLDETHVTLAERLKDAGYSTAAFLSTSRLDPRTGITQGFELVSKPVLEQFRSEFTGSSAATPELQRSAESTSEAALDWINTVASPFFGWVELNASALRSSSSVDATPEERHRSVQEALERAIAPLLTSLERGDRSRVTLVVLVGACGESWGDGGRYGSGGSIDETCVHVPLWIADPSNVDAEPVLQSVSLSDVGDLLGFTARPAAPAPLLLECWSPWIEASESMALGVVHHDQKIHRIGTEWFTVELAVPPAREQESRRRSNEAEIAFARTAFGNAGQALAERVATSAALEQKLSAALLYQEAAFPSAGQIPGAALELRDRLLARAEFPPSPEKLSLDLAELDQLIALCAHDSRFLEWCAALALALPEDVARCHAQLGRLRVEGLPLVAEALPYRPFANALSVSGLARFRESVPAAERAHFVDNALRVAPWYFPAVREAAYLRQFEPSAMQEIYRAFDEAAPMSSVAREDWKRRWAKSQHEP